MDWNLVRKHVANTTVEERNAKRQEVSSDDVEVFAENYEKVSSGVANSAGSNSYVSSAERTANANALNALERRRKRAQEYLEKKTDSYKNGKELLSEITNAENDIEVLKRANTAANNYWSQWESEADYNDYLDYVKEQERLEHLNIKEARDKKYALEQERDRLGQDIRNEVGQLGTVSIVASGRKGQNQNAYYGLTSKETEQRRLELEREIQALDRDINLASRIQQANFERDFALEAPDFEEYSLAGKNIRNDLAEQASNVYTHEAFSKNYRNPNVIDQTVRFMNDEQRQIYDYYLGKYGKERADEYLYTIADDVNMRRAEAIYEGSEDNIVYQTLLTLASGIEQWGEGTKSVAQMLMGNEEYRPQSSVLYAAGMVREDLADVGVLPEWATNIVGDTSLGQMAFDLTQTTANMLPSIILGHLGGGIVGSVSLGLSASGNAYQEMIKEGYNKEQASSYAALVGASETLLEHVLGGIGALGGKLSKAATTKLLTKVDNALARVAVNLASKGFSEFTEEYLQEILDPFFRNLALMEENEIELITPDAIYAGLLGALSAGVLEGGNVIGGEIQYQKADKALAEKYSALAKEAIENGLQRAEGSNMRKLAEAAQKKQEKGKDLSGRQMQELVLGEDKARIAEAAENRLKTLGETKDTTVVAKAIQKTVTGEDLSAKERVALNHSTYGKRVLNELDPFNIVSESTSSAWTKDIGTREIGKDFYSRPKVEAKATEAEAQKTEEAKPVDIVEEAFKKSGIRIGSVGISSKDTVREVLSNIEGITPEAAEKLANVYEEEGGGVSANEFIRKTAKAFNIGYLNTPVESVKAVFSNSSVSPSAMMRAYYIGSETFAKKHKGEALASQATTIKGVKGKVVFEKGVDRNKLKPQQRVAVEVMEKVLADATNVEFHIYESYVRDGKRYYIDEFGVEQEGAPNGKFVGNVHQIWIDINAGGKGEGTMLFTLFHELTHNIHIWSPEHFNTLAKITAEAFTKGGYSFEDAVNSKMAQYAKYENYTRDNCIEEVVAEAMSGLGYDGKVIEDIANQVKAQDKTLWQKIVDWLGSIVDRIKKAYAQLSPSAPEAKILMQQKELFEQAQKVFAEAVVTAGQNYKNAGVEIDVSTESVAPSDTMLSERTWSESEYVKARNETARAIASELDVSLDKAYDYIDSINSVAKAIADDRARLDYDPNLDEHATVLKPNSEYGVTVDMSTLCAKRLLTTGTFDAIQKKLPNMVFDSEDIVKLRKMMMDRGYEVACGICYVESTRREMGRITQEFIDRYKIAQQTGKPIARVNASGQEVVLKSQGKTFMAEKEYTPNLGELNTTDIDLVKRDHPKVYNAYLAFMNARGQAKPKLLETRAEYKGEILKMFKKKDSVEKKNLEGGLRLQSFSDFELPHLIDMMQIVMDMSRVGLKSQAYTKVPKFAEAFGGTGIKINLSLIAKGSGVDKNGNLVFDDVEGINHEEAFRIRDKFSNNVGTILVGKNDEHIRAAMADPRIDMIIPFHKSSWKESLYEALGLTGYTDYTKYQMEKPIDRSRGKIEQFHSDEYWDYSKTGDENAQIYLQKCREDGRTPVFPQFQNEPGYWKMLIDFKMYDNDGVGAPHEVVKPIFDNEYNAKILEEYKGGHRKLPVAQDIVDDFVKEYDTGTKFQDRDSDGFKEYDVVSAVYAIRNEKAGRNEDLVKIGTMPSIYRDLFELSGDVFVSNSHLYKNMVSIDTAIKESRHTEEEKSDYHELGEQKIINAIEQFQNPMVIMESLKDYKTPRLVAILDEKGHDGQNLIGVMELYEEKSVPKIKQGRNHILMTIYEKNDLPDYIEKTVGKNRILYIDKRVSSETSADLRLVGDISEETLKKNITQFNKKVKDFKEDNDIRYSLREVEPVQPTSDKWERTSTTSEVMARFPDLWNVAAEESETRNPTQITGTVRSYRKIYDFLKDEGFDGKILDASSGLGYGTRAGIEEYGFNVEDIEPYPDKNYHPKYKDYSSLNKKYDVIISNAVLNVIPQDQRDALVVKMGELLNEGGRIFINVRGKDVENASSKVAINKDLMEYYISNTGSYQKGFTKDELVAYLQDALGDDFTVEKSNLFGAVSAVVTKKADSMSQKGTDIRYQEREEDLSERGILAKALESAAQGDIEAKNLKNYKKHLAEYDELNVQLHLMKVELDEARKAKDTAKVKELKDKITQTENRLAVFDKRLLKLEAAAPLKALVERERKNAVARADERLSKALESQKKKDAEKLDKALERAKESRQKTIDKLRENSKVKNQEMKRVLRESQEFARDAAKMRKMGEQYEAQIQKGKERLSEQKLMAEQKLLAQAERYRTSIKNATEGRHRTEIRNKIKHKIGQLNALLNGGKERHVPEAMRGAVASALDIINLDDQRYYTSRLNNLRDKLAKATSSAEQKNIAFEIQKIELQQARFKDSIDELKASWEEIRQENDGLYDPLIAEKIDRVSLDIGKTLLHDMSMTQLEEIYDLYSMVLKRVQEANKLHDEQKKGEISELGKQAITEFSSMKQRKKIVSENKLDREKFSWNNEKPIYAFMRIGSKVLQERFEAIRNGEDTWARDISEAMDFFEKAKKQYNFKKWNKEKTFEFESSAGDKFKLDIEQMMSIYAYSKRKDADKHLMEGGFVFDPRTEIKKSKRGNKKLIQKHLEDATTYNISAETIQEIASKLTEEQRGYVDMMQNYLSEVMGAKGNEVSMAMYDVKLFREKNYFPLKSSNLYRFETDNPAGEIKLKNSGFSKDRIPGANNPIVLTGFTDVWAGHVNDMSMYHAFVLPIDDFTRVYNYRTPIFPHQKSVKAELENVHGPAASAYIKKLLEDINGGARVDSTVGVWNRLVGRFKKASVMASLSVVIQQPSAIMRAFAEINPKYLIGLPKVPIIQHAKTWNEIKKYAPVAVIKDMGYFDTNMGLSTIDYIKGEKNAMEKVDDFFGKLPGYADEATWGAIWHMVKRETKKKHPSLKVSSDEFLELCGKRFTDIVVKTQVYDSVLSRSANMRSTDGLMKMATAFMAEPTTSINMLAQAVRDGKKHPGKSMAIATSVVSSVIFNSALSSLVYAMRDEEEDETFWEKYVKNFSKEILDGFNILTYLPLYKDIWSIIQGWDIKRSDMDLIDKLHTKLMTLSSLVFIDTEDMSEEEKKEYNKQLGWAIAETTGALGDLFGIPAKNLIREFKGAINTYNMWTRQHNEETKLESTKLSMKHVLADGLIDILPETLLEPLDKFGIVKDRNVQDKIYEAVMAGDTEYLNRLKKDFDSDKDFNKQIRWALRNNDERLVEAVIARHEGRFEDYENLVKEMVADGFSKQNVITAVEAETFDMFPEETEETVEKIKGLYNADDFLVAYNKNNKASMEVIRDDIIKTYVANGKTEDEAEAKFNSTIYSAVRERYENSEITEAAARKILEDHGGKTEQNAKAAVTLWDYQAQYPDDDVEIYWINDYYEDIEAFGVGLKTYVDYRNDAKLCKGKDANGDGKTDSGSVKKEKLLIIDALPISKEQKDAIYFSEGWAKSTLWEAPWR